MKTHSDYKAEGWALFGEVAPLYTILKRGDELRYFGWEYEPEDGAISHLPPVGDWVDGPSPGYPARFGGTLTYAALARMGGSASADFSIPFARYALRIDGAGTPTLFLVEQWGPDGLSR